VSNNHIDTLRPDAPELAAYGALPVGVRTLELVHKDQLNIVAEGHPRYDRPLTVELWYPAQAGTGAAHPYPAMLRDGATRIKLHGRALRDAVPQKQTRYPLIVLSHGYPGSRHLLSHLAENLASKGYVVAAPDHTDSTYADQGRFEATLYHRPLDQRFVIDAVPDFGEIAEITETNNVAVVGFSMGGYGALTFAGAGLSKATVDLQFPNGNNPLERHIQGTDTHNTLVDPRVKAIIPIGPWGMNEVFWDADGLNAMRKPMLLMAGSLDDISDYDAMRAIFEGTTQTTRHLLTFENAGHNAAAPIPAPAESWRPSPALDFMPFTHYADPVWDTARMNNIAQHYATAFLDLHLKGMSIRAAHLTLFEGARGLRFETLEAA